MGKLAYKKGGRPGPHATGTPASLSAQALRRSITLPLGDFTQDTTNNHGRGPVGFACRVVGAYLSCTTKPAGGTLSTQVFIYDASANAAVEITDAFDPEGLTNLEASALTLSGDNPTEIAPEDTWRIANVADDNAVSQQQVDGYITLIVIPTEDDEDEAGLVDTAEDL